MQQLPTYQQNVRQKIRDVRWRGHGQVIDTAQATVEDIQSEIAKGEPTGTTAKPITVEATPTASLWGHTQAPGPPLSSACAALRRT